MTDLYAVFGNPINHSKSPSIHRMFAEQTGQDLHYTKQLVDVDKFAQTADAFFAQGGRGLNITVPFKQEAFRYAHSLTPRAERAGAVNFLVQLSDGSIRGDNTDGIGMVHDMHNLDWNIAGKRVLLLGAGGAVRGVLQPLLEEHPAQVVIANRTLSKAEELAKNFLDLGNVEAKGYDQLNGAHFDIVINGTSASLHGELPPLPDNLLNPGACCYDMMYGAEPTVFLQWAQQQGAAHTADGLGMLVGQAAEAFYLWRQIRPEVVPVLTALRRQLHEKK
ncbi:shikimate dehydrogenase [Cellvibrio japonicus]|uniref:Shikimate dehydrogenase (NADP(+)) n=1 Tax=Cellvibrio japonicus (strain Ueda107) TaxID=498211 RepID=AROE_CELJU|nr:shikimate dehydrogenase [Cellvibrio japonicus]B3PGZ3.1 RecName: Full=Shikimate dehydrogenase (NADP(+)); Short=SDH [Cellvibrio japonicus Ueda107]ACE84806.1 shikimate 5-dehydrogenase [Cellvibrio japonicus Ueda107]QEI13795.1 shikimate dehydrogenase [Cellvibrio japonicus]QEI17369.1 shikimate dehydrogenase [Cellvibrio japonicus]QEI20945.1 shikimate dehydrogenase [Cellvibrio japonicus]